MAAAVPSFHLLVAAASHGSLVATDKDGEEELVSGFMLTRPSSLLPHRDTDVSVHLRPQLSSSTPAARSADMAPKGSNKQQSEEDLLLQDFSRNLSAKSTALFYGNALIVSAIPICEYRAAAKLAGLAAIHRSFGI